MKTLRVVSALAQLILAAWMLAWKRDLLEQARRIGNLIEAIERKEAALKRREIALDAYNEALKKNEIALDNYHIVLNEKHQDLMRMKGKLVIRETFGRKG